MGKVVDITEKLTFDENPILQIKGVKVEVNADAPTVLQIMGIMNDDQDVLKAYELLFAEKERKKLDKLKLGFKDLTCIIEVAMSLASGTYGDDMEESEGE